ncbi:hypothetical protein EV385_0385 [Krasilnikovia cinnamomea]|uniref:PPE family protein n=1 Tax=Krasilnikovia cinnamomea TaxID=349313 RepID=A0A4Q7ZDA4_9ACTN|nr:hypothetical protein [Krasilnikovia cinnamomea]RZU48667.1 hypothetical protein EV385_0385 [Krasilnikovia cinnamomea]
MSATNWDNYNLPAIEDMLKGENACTGADRVLAWEGLASSVREQHRRLAKAAEDLAAVWPPEKNASALAFQKLIDELGASMAETLTCAEDTRAGLRGVLDAISTAQTTIRTLSQGRAEVSDDLTPRFIDHAEDEYDEQAQQVMREAEAAIRDHNPQIRAPQLFRMEIRKGEDGGDFPVDPGDPGNPGGGSGQAAIHARPLPVAVPHDPVLVGEPPHSAVTAPGTMPGHDPSPGVGPGLAGSTITPAGPLPGQGLGGFPGGSAAGGTLPGAVIGGGAGNAAAGLIAGAGGAGALGMLGAGGLGAFGAPGAGAIGGAAGGGLGVPGGLGVSGGPGAAASRQAVPMRRGMPSGAVIGADGHGAGGRGQSPFGVPGQRPGRRSEDGAGMPEGEADQQWATADGVQAVIVPDATQARHDPGPGVLGFPR